MRQKTAVTLFITIVALLFALNLLTVSAEPFATAAIGLTQGGDLLASVADGAAFVLNSDLYHVGGWAGNVGQPVASIYRTTLNNGTPGSWSLASMSNETKRFGAAGVVYNGRAYLLGGYNGLAIQNTIYTSMDGTSWTPANRLLPQARNFPAVAVADGRLYVAGGSPGTGADVWSAILNSDGSLGAWKTDEPRLPIGLTTQLAAYENCLFAIGGKDNTSARHAEAYRASTNADGLTSGWASTTALPQALALHTVAVREESGTPYLYVFGGETTSGGYSNQIYYTTINAASCTLAHWNSTPLPNNQGRRRAVATVADVNGYRGLYLIGGQIHDGSWSKNTFYNVLSIATPTPIPSVSIQKWTTPASSVGYGESITYVVAYSNTWAYSQTIVITDQVPNNTSLQLSQGATVRPGNVLRWEVPNVVSHTGGRVSYTVMISPSVRTWELNQSISANWPIDSSVQTVNRFEGHTSSSEIFRPVTWSAETLSYARLKLPNDRTVSLQAPVTDIVLDGPTVGFVDTAYVFTATAAITDSEPITYVWQATNQTQVITHENASAIDTAFLTWNMSGTQQVTVTAYSADNVEPVTVTFDLVVSAAVPLTAVTIIGPIADVVNAATVFTATPSPITVTEPITYAWLAPDATLVDASNVVTCTWTTAGPHAITVTAQNGWGFVTATQVITLHVPPGAADLLGPDTGNVGQPNYFIATVDPLTTTSPITYIWSISSLGEVITHADQTALFDYAVFTWTTPITADNVSVRAATAWGEITATHQITIGAKPVAYQPITQVTLSGPSAGAIGASYTFTGTVQPLNATTPIYFIWDATDQDLIGNLSITTTNNVSYTWSTPGRKDITLLVMNDGQITSTTHLIDMAPNALTELTLVGPTGPSFIGADYVFTATVNPTATLPITYEWQATNQGIQTISSVLSTTHTITYNWQLPGQKIITVTAAGARGAAAGYYSVTLVPSNARLTYTLAFTPSVSANKGVLITGTLPVGWSPYTVFAAQPFTYTTGFLQTGGVTYTQVVWRLTGSVSRPGTVTVVACRNTDDVLSLSAIRNTMTLDDASKVWTSETSQSVSFLAQIPSSCEGAASHPGGSLPLLRPDILIRNQAWISTTYLSAWQPSNEVVTFWPEAYLYLPLVRK